MAKIDHSPDAHACAPHTPAFQHIELDEIDSTNNFLKHFTPATPVPLTLVTAECQTHGRGAGQNSWESQPGQNLLLSLMLHPQALPASQMFGLSQALALAVHATVEHFAGPATVKWPNDVYVGNSKVAGLLIENDITGRYIQRSIMGVGLNVNQTRFVSSAPNPISLAQIVGHTIPRSQVLDRLMAEWHHSHQLMLEDAEQLHRRYLHRLYRWHQRHQYRDAQGTFEARIVYVEPSGHLCLADNHGQLRRYAFKEIEYII